MSSMTTTPHDPRIVAVAAPVDVAFVARELDAERVVAAWRTHETLREMRYETPRLTAIKVLFDIVQALRCKHRSE